jgi:hypothetical protein
VSAVSTPQIRMFAVAIAYGLLAVLVVLVGACLVYLVQGEQDGSATRSLLVECVIPPEEREPPADEVKGDCYVRSQARTGQAVGQISDLSILAAACGAAHPGDVPATRECVEKAMEDR